MDRRNGHGSTSNCSSSAGNCGNGKIPWNHGIETSYTSVIVVRRYTCYEKTTLRKKRRLQHEGFLNIYGLHPNFTSSLTHELKSLQYKLICNCLYCISYQETVKTTGLTFEPLMAGVSLVFSYLSGFNYSLSSSTTVQNPDGSNSTTWVWTICQSTAKVSSDI